MPAPQRFTTAPPDPNVPPLQFILDGTTTPDSDGKTEPWEETFTVVDLLPPGALADLVYAITVNDEGDLEYNAVGCVRFLRAVIVSDDERRFDVLIRDKRRLVDLPVLAAALMFINGEKTSRPTGPRPGSLNGSRATEGGSEADSSTQDTAEG